MISVAIATFNGDKYIKEQILSIVNQTLAASEIIISDDNSSDNTISIIEELMLDFPEIKLFKNYENLGVIKNFNKAIRLCSGDYIALCDQDDFWEPSKLETQFSLMKKYELFSSKPYLIVHDVTLVDSNLNVIDSSFLNYTGLLSVKNSFKQLLVWNRNIGCSMFFNKRLKLILGDLGDNALMHDHWISLIAVISGEIILLDHNCIKYRQHNHNVTKTIKRNLFDVLISFFYQDSSYLVKQINQAKEFYQSYDNVIKYSDRLVLRRFIRLEQKSVIFRKCYVLILKIFNVAI